MKALKNKVQVVLTGLAMILVVATAEAVDYKIGVVNVQKVLTSIPQTEAATKKLEKEFGSRDRDIGKDNKALEELADRLKKDGAIMSDSERSRVERDIQTKQRDLKRKAEEFQEDLNFRRNEEMQAIQKKIAANVRDYAKENAFDFVLVNSAVYFSDRVDLTGAIVERMKKAAN
jgi:Outer membrane protein